MERIRFANWVAIVGVAGGVLIALGFPGVVLYFGFHLSNPTQTVLVMMGLIMGVVLAAIAAVVGITIPSTVNGNGADIEKLAGGSRGVSGEEAGRGTPSAESS